MSILNTARSGYFSSDRTVRGYCRDIWHVEPVPVPAYVVAGLSRSPPESLSIDAARDPADEAPACRFQAMPAPAQ